MQSRLALLMDGQFATELYFEGCSTPMATPLSSFVSPPWGRIELISALEGWLMSSKKDEKECNALNASIQLPGSRTEFWLARRGFDDTACSMPLSRKSFEENLLAVDSTSTNKIKYLRIRL